ncbi:inositol monophosphatase family protein [Agrobacterium rosae]|uniref:Inositol-1-monophosphatase n=1 Tax=Agrobacterium rosae TaxID=1972867 RepID=A0AAE5VN59_9HYPH|nr:inositol monophosphatase family protein [Agrobacterium rosae]KAA3515307.1 inositol monophosphatase [Agrobacterium rosae]KAA3524274.1 inositol monophosphatase [Agrobacterium rosae]MCM2431166.1 inositol monophosphatase [Agrobacterium rosae]MDX8312814.1 inositol monophosphatase family protein [Agrobacterium rosae]MDX8329169.1 inositol monophosphatase family protein [Agrobacterium rosae]
MQSTQQDIEARLTLAQEMALEAGAKALDYFNNRDALVIETKRDPQDVVSIADREVENLIRDRVAQAFPEDGFLGEEYGLIAGTSSFTWVVDPIDGTSPFVNGMPNWCVSIAVISGGEPVVGVINAPCHSEIYSSALGMGATLNGKALTLDSTRTISNSVTGIGANNYVTPAFVASMIEDLLSSGGNFIRNGSGALMLAYVAAGRLVGYYEPYMHAWDCMAGFCLVREAGGWFHPFPTEGEKLTKGAPVIAAAPGAIDDLSRIAGLTGKAEA